MSIVIAREYIAPENLGKLMLYLSDKMYNIRKSLYKKHKFEVRCELTLRFSTSSSLYSIECDFWSEEGIEYGEQMPRLLHSNFHIGSIKTMDGYKDILHVVYTIDDELKKQVFCKEVESVFYCLEGNLIANICK